MRDIAIKILTAEYIRLWFELLISLSRFLFSQILGL